MRPRRPGGILLVLFLASCGPGRTLHAQESAPAPAAESPAALTAPAAESPAAPAASTTPAASTAPAPPAEYIGFSTPRVVEEDRRQLLAVDAAIQAEKWGEAAALLDHLLGPAAATVLPRIDLEGDRLVTADGIHFSSVALEVRRRVEKLPAAGLDAWRARRGEAGKAKVERESESEPAAAPGTPVESAPSLDSEWRCVLGRPDHAALELSGKLEWRPGGYARWAYKLTNARKLESSTPAKNAYYAYAPMQLVSSGGLLIGRLHQDIVALDRATGDVRWRVESELPASEQSHQDGRTSGFDSWRYFSDIGGWSLAVIPGEQETVIVTSRSGRGRVNGGKLAFQRNVLRAYEARTGTLLWRRGGSEDPEEVLRALTFAAPPVRAGAKGDVLVAPATSDGGYLAVGLTPSGGLLWVKKLYSYLPESFEMIDESFGFGASLAAHGDVVVGAPGQGLVFAISSRGETIWEARYPSGVRQTLNDPRWAPCHPIVSGGKAVVAPFEGDGLLAIDLKTGVAAWTKRFLTGYHCLLGADASRVFFMDGTGRVTALSLVDGAAVWTSEALGPPAGRGFVTSSSVYAAAGRSVVLLDAAKGTVIKKCKVWDERVPEPVPGNLFLSRGELFVAGAWGYAGLEPYEATLAALDSLGIREQLLRRAMISHALGNYVEALDSLRKALASTSEEAAREFLRVELLQIAQEAAATTRDTNFVRRVLEEPDLLPTRAHRTAFALRSAELLGKESPGDAARLYRELADEPPSGDLVASPEGAYVDVQIYASDALRELIVTGKVKPLEEEEEKVAAWVEGALGAENPAPHLSAMALRYSHAPSAAAASAHLSRLAAEAKDFAAAANHLERMLADDPSLGEIAGLKEHLRDLRAKARPGGEGEATSAGAIDVGHPWRRVFLGKSEGADLVSIADGSEPLPGMLIAKDGMIAFLDDAGKVVWKHKQENAVDVKEARARVQGVLVEPSSVYARGDRALVFTAQGLLEITGLGGASPSARTWLPLEHPLKKHLAAPPSGGGTVTIRRGNVTEVRTTGGQPAGKINVNDNENFFPRLELDAEGNPHIVEPDGTLVVMERRTGRIRYRSESSDESSAGAPIRAGELVAVESAKPPGLIVHDPRTRARVVIATPATPWCGIVVPGVAVVLDSSAGIQVRALTFASNGEDAEAGGNAAPALWRDVKPRGILSLAYADAAQVIASEPEGRLTSRALRSGRGRWSVPFPAGASPVKVFEVEEKAAGTRDLVIVVERGFDPEDGRGVLGQRIAQDLSFIRVSLNGEKRWEVVVAEGGVAYSGARVVTGKDTWVVAFNHKAKEWKTRGVVLDVEKGAVRDLFELDLESKPNHPPPRLLWTRSGIAVGSSGTWALFVP